MIAGFTKKVLAEALRCRGARRDAGTASLRLCENFPGKHSQAGINAFPEVFLGEIVMGPV